MVRLLQAVGTIHDDFEDGRIMIIISYKPELEAFLKLRKQWEAAGSARVLDLGE